MAEINVISTVHADRLSSAARRNEIAAMLAVALVRLRTRHHPSLPEQLQKGESETQVLLGFSGNQSVHDNQSTRE